MHLNHLGLTVRDQQRSLAFYEAYFHFYTTTARTYPDGTVIVCNPDGFDLALHSGETPRQSSFLHFGFALASPDDVHTLLARMSADGIQIVERDDEPDLVSFKCLDPDGWRIEVYWELARPG
jgi:catechol 2,3-dioxygenase-like lactoylglutathione lyase family enzyme